MEYTFLGSESVIGSTTLNFFGQRVELSETLAADAIKGGCALLPSDHDAVKVFTADEFAKYNSVGMQAFAPPEFIEKRKAAWLAVAELRAELEG